MWVVFNKIRYLLSFTESNFGKEHRGSALKNILTCIATYFVPDYSEVKRKSDNFASLGIFHHNAYRIDFIK